MPAVKKNLMVERGTTWEWSPRYKDSTGNPVDLTGYTATVDLYSKGIKTLTFTATVTADGYMHFKEAPAVTVALDDEYYYNLDVTSPSGDVKRLAFGEFKARGLA